MTDEQGEVGVVTKTTTWTSVSDVYGVFLLSCVPGYPDPDQVLPCRIHQSPGELSVEVCHTHNHAHDHTHSHAHDHTRDYAHDHARGHTQASECQRLKQEVLADVSLLSSHPWSWTRSWTGTGPCQMRADEL